jgi:molybdopterin molybdotransferase
MSIDTCLAAEGRLLSLDEGLRLILADITPLAHKERLPLKTAQGRVLAEDVPAALDLPPFTNSAMDGYALRAADTSAGETRLATIGTSWAGKPYDGSVGPGQCVRIFTGAALPEGADAVVMQEDVAVEGDGIRLAGPLKPGKNVRQAGEELRRGELALTAGKRLLPAKLALLAAMGLNEVEVKTKPRVAFFSTGDELRGVGGPLRPGQIYDSNRYAMDGLLWEADADTLDMGAVADEPIALKSALLQAAAMADVVVTTGGVSVGDADFVTGVLAEIGQVKLWKLAIKPGKPIAFGRIGQAWFFGLPGNPVAVMVTFLQLLRPALDKLAGIPPRQPLRFAALSHQALKKSPGRTEFLRGRLQRDSDGQWWVNSVAAQGSHMLSGMSQADCLIVLPAECAGVAEGEAVEVEPLACHWR